MVPTRWMRKADHDKITVTPNLSGSIIVDDWRTDDEPFLVTEQVVALFNFGLVIRQDSAGTFTLAGEYGQGYGDVTRVERTSESPPQESATFATPLDATAKLDYGWAPRKRTWGFNVGTKWNLPTGTTELSELQRLSMPNTSIVSRPLAGKGLNGGLSVGISCRSIFVLTGASPGLCNASLESIEGEKETKNWIHEVKLVGGFTRNGSYDPTNFKDGDERPANSQYDAAGEWVHTVRLMDGKSSPTATVSPKLAYRRVQDDDSDRTVSTITPSLPIKLAWRGLTTIWSISGSFKLEDRFDDALQELLRQNVIKDERKVAATAGYKIAFPSSFDVAVTPRVMFEHRWNGAGRDDDETFFTTKLSRKAGLGALLALGPKSLGLTSEFDAQFIEALAYSSDSTPITFQGTTVMVKVSAAPQWSSE